MRSCSRRQVAGPGWLVVPPLVHSVWAGLRLSALPVPLRLSARERWLLLPGPSLLSSSFLELSSLLRSMSPTLQIYGSLTCEIVCPWLLCSDVSLWATPFLLLRAQFREICDCVTSSLWAREITFPDKNHVSTLWIHQCKTYIWPLKSSEHQNPDIVTLPNRIAGTGFCFQHKILQGCHVGCGQLWWRLGMGIRRCSHWHFATDLSFYNCLRLPLPRTKIILENFQNKWVETIVVEAEAADGIRRCSHWHFGTEPCLLGLAQNWHPSHTSRNISIGLFCLVSFLDPTSVILFELPSGSFYPEHK